MNVIGTPESTFEKEKSMKIIKIIIIMLVLLLIISIGIVIGIYYLQSKEFKVSIDGKNRSNIGEDVFVIQDGKVYVSIKDIAQYLNYTAYNGGYGGNDKYSENTTSCYLQNTNETVTYSLNSTSIYKSIISEKTSENSSQNANINSLAVANSDFEYFTLSEPVKMINSKLYTTLEGIATGCNVYANYNEKNNAVVIYTLPTIISSYANTIQDMAIADEDAIFSNKKAILYDLVVVKNENNKYGVVGTDGQEILGKKYAYIKFTEATQEFIVLTDEGKVGIISKDGTTRIKPDYDEIKLIDKESELYLVSNNKKYGVINRNDKKIIYLEYDAIGIDSTKFESDNIKNQYILYDNCIPVQKGGKWGLMDKNGATICDLQFDEIGCIVGTSNSKMANNLLLIPEYEGIVVGKDKLYGLINSSGQTLIPIAVSDMYSITNANEETYYLTYEKNTMNVIDYLRDTLKIEPVDKSVSNNTKGNVLVDNNNTQADDNSQTNTEQNENQNNNANVSVSQSDNSDSNVENH